MKSKYIHEYLTEHLHMLTLEKFEIEKEMQRLRYMLDYLTKQEDKCTNDDSESMEGMFSHLQSEKASDSDSKNKEAKQNRSQGE